MGRATPFHSHPQPCLSSKKKQNTKKTTNIQNKQKKNHLLHHRAKQPNTWVTFGSIPFVPGRRCVVAKKNKMGAEAIESAGCEISESDCARFTRSHFYVILTKWRWIATKEP
jgi:hypothetical protein